jgi:hypothetical protein
LTRNDRTCRGDILTISARSVRPRVLAICLPIGSILVWPHETWCKRWHGWRRWRRSFRVGLWTRLGCNASSGHGW